jgi:hypothetical protein
MLIVIPADIARRIDHARSTEQTRYYLNGFSVMPSPAGGVEVCATDGHILSLFHASTGEVDKESGESWPIVALSKTELAACGKPVKGFPGTLFLVVEGDFQRSSLTIVHGDDSAMALELARGPGDGAIAYQCTGKHFIDGCFPDYRRVIPGENLRYGSCPHFNAALLYKLGKCVENSKTRLQALTIAHNQDNLAGPMLVTTENHEYRDSWLGVLMPLAFRDAPPAAVPGWLNPKPVEDKPAEVPELEAAE